jgi:ubiquinone/menaquinone biosynthesis C-methylase UbiE
VSNREIARSFDQISKVYDETRDPLDPATLDRVADGLRKAGVRSLLEIGVGTGRIARPLLDRGFDVAGVDLSRGMLAHARAKGVVRVARASGYRLPFEARSFDATLMVHVLHILERPSELLREAGRVSRVGTFAIVNPRRRATDGVPGTEESPRRVLHDILAAQGYPVRPFASIPRRESRLLERWPPDAIEVVEERDVTVTLASRLDRLAKRGHRNLLHVPPRVLARAVAAARAQVGDRTVTAHRVLGLAFWSREPRRRRPRATARSGAPSRTAAPRRHGSTRARSRSGARSAPRSGRARRPARTRRPPPSTPARARPSSA